MNQPVPLSVAAAHYGVTYTALYFAVRRGALPATKPGRDWFVDLRDVEQYLDGRPDRWQDDAAHKERTPDTAGC